LTYAGSKGNVGFARIAFVEEVKPFPFCHNDCFEVPNRSSTREDEQQLWAESGHRPSKTRTAGY